MVDTVYIESQVLEHARTQAILDRYPQAQQIEIERYAEVFNSHNQNFRLQKSNPSLILAGKQNQRVHSTPIQYETGGGANYYFSHMLNCLYDCRYCFLQGMYRSANYLLFVNYEDFVDDIRELALKHRQDSKPVWFFSGYDCDSLALEPMTGFAEHFLPIFDSIENAVLELRTKSTQIRRLLEHKPNKNVVVAFSLSPDPVARTVEQGAPSVEKRLQAMRKLQDAGWRVGARFDPLIWHQGWQQHYQDLVTECSSTLQISELDSITLGGFRLPKGYYKTMRKLYSDHWLFSAGLAKGSDMVSYTSSIEKDMFASLVDRLGAFVEPEKIFCYPTENDVE